MATIDEILRMPSERRKLIYEARNIGVVKIDGNPFSDYNAFSFVWEKSYIKSPERSGNGSITNLNSQATFLTPHLKIDFSMMSIDSYRRLMELIYSKNEFVVECYDVVNNKITSNKMYFATEEMPKLWAIARELSGENWVELLGVQNYTVELIGTNAPIDMVRVYYYDYDKNLVFVEEKPKFGGSATLSIQPNIVGYVDGQRFIGWEDDNGTRYKNEEQLVLGKSISLYAQSSDQYILMWERPSTDSGSYDYKLYINGTEISGFATIGGKDAYSLFMGTSVKVTKNGSVIFDGTMDSDLRISFVSGNCNVGSFDASYERIYKSHDISYSGGSSGGSMSSQELLQVDGFSAKTVLTQNKFTNTSGRFVGWTSQSGEDIANKQVVTLTSDLNLSAKWGNQYLLRWRRPSNNGASYQLLINGVDISGFATVGGEDFYSIQAGANIQVKENGSVKHAKTMDRDWDIYIASSCEMNQFDGSTLILTQPYTISYATTAGATGSMPSTQKILQVKGKPAKTTISLNGYTAQEGYYFVSFKDQNGTDRQYGQLITMTSNLELKTTWSNLYTVTWWKENGTNQTSTSNTGPVTKDGKNYYLQATINGTDFKDLGRYFNSDGLTTPETIQVQYGSTLYIQMINTGSKARGTLVASKDGNTYFTLNSSDGKWVGYTDRYRSTFKIKGNTAIAFEWKYEWTFENWTYVEESYWNTHIAGDVEHISY